MRIGDGMREEPPHSPFEQLRSRGLPTLYDLRRVLEYAAADPSIKKLSSRFPRLGLDWRQRRNCTIGCARPSRRENA